MTAKKTSAKKTIAQAAPKLGPGLHLAKIELRSGDAWRVRILGGGAMLAELDDEVDVELAKECLARGRRVVVVNGERGPVIAGALQTSRPLAKEADGQLAIRAKTIRLKADQRLVLESGESALRLEADGVCRVQGDKMMIDVGGLVRFLAASVEFP